MSSLRSLYRAIDPLGKGKDSVATYQKGADYEPVELVEELQVQTAFLHEPFVCVLNENSSEDEAE